MIMNDYMEDLKTSAFIGIDIFLKVSYNKGLSQQSRSNCWNASV